MVDALQNAHFGGECFSSQNFPFTVRRGPRTAPALSPAVEPHKTVLTGGALLALNR